MTDERRDLLDGTLAETSQRSLRVAAVLPLIMAIAFLLIILYYSMTGGYKPVVLNPDEPGAAH